MASKINIPRTIIESPLFDKGKSKITKDTRKLDEVLLGVTFAAACNPELFPETETAGVRVAKTDPTENIPPLTFYFKEFEGKIILLDVEVTPEDNSEG